MKTKLLLIGKIGLVIIGLCLFLFICGFGHYPIGAWQVEKIQLTARDQAATTTVELTHEEIQQFVVYYNLARYAGPVTAEGCERTFYVCIYLKDGRKIGIVDHDDARMKITGIAEQFIWCDNALLLEFIKQLVSDYGLRWEVWGCC